MRNRQVLVFCLIVLLALTGCASTKITNRQQVVSGQLPRPARIWVHDFAAAPGELPPDSALAVEFSGGATDLTHEQIATGRKLGAIIAAELVTLIRDMGMPAEQAGMGAPPQINDIVIRGCILSFEEGSATKRVTIGFGSGSSELRAAAEGLQVTSQGLRVLGFGASDSGGGKSPGAAVGAATMIATANPVGLIVSGGMKVYGEASGSSKIEGRAKKTAKEIADVLKERFREQGWLQD